MNKETGQWQLHRAAAPVAPRGMFENESASSGAAWNDPEALEDFGSYTTANGATTISAPQVQQQISRNQTLFDALMALRANEGNAYSMDRYSQVGSLVSAGKSLEDIAAELGWNI
jgi:hypothetical protein